MPEQPKVSERIRSNVLAIALCFAVLTGTAEAAGSGGDGPKATSAAASATKQIKKLKRKLSGLEDRLAALEGRAGPTIPTSLPPSGQAGGELTGTYPNPLIGTVSGLDLATSTSPTGGINFGSGTSLYRSAPGTINTDGMLSAEELVAGSYLKLRARKVAGPPPTTDCDGSTEIGRVEYNATDEQLYVCDDGTGTNEIWKAIPPRVFQGSVAASTPNALLFSVPQLKVSITSDSSAASAAGLRVQNDNASGSGVTIVVGTTADATGGFPVNPNDISPDISGTATPVIVTSTGVSGVSLMITCTLGASSNQICVGYLNGP